MLTRVLIEKREKETLAPYAVCSVDSRGRKYKEEPCEFRTAFQRDHDRIVHSTAFRRLEYKTQVFVNHEGDYYRTRLTHTLEVAQMSRGIGRTLRLNEDLAEAIALCHDLGHTPFGHAGEEVLSRLMKDHGGFEHNLQSLRIVTKIENRYPEFPGLNLSYEVLEGIQKHSGFSSIEAQIVDIADEIAYTNHDIDDGLESGMLHLDQLEEVGLWTELFHPLKKRFPEASLKILKYQVIRSLIHKLLRDVKEETLRRIEKNGITSSGDIKEKKMVVVGFSPETLPQVKELKKFLFENLYKHRKVRQMAGKMQKVVEELFTIYIDNPKVLPQPVQKRIGEEEKERIVCDYIAGMTDRFALEEHKKFWGHDT